MHNAGERSASVAVKLSNCTAKLVRKNYFAERYGRSAFSENFTAVDQRPWFVPDTIFASLSVRAVIGAVAITLTHDELNASRSGKKIARRFDYAEPRTIFRSVVV